VTEPSFESLRDQLRERGYLSRGIERWFALDPWKSRTFWSELLVVALKAGVLTGSAAAVFMTAVMLLRNRPASAIDAAALFVLYALSAIAMSMLLVTAVGLLLKSRPELAIDRPAGLLAIAVTCATLVIAPMVLWWRFFDAGSTTPELIAGAALIAATFAIAVVAISAALLSFSIYELRRIPAIHRTSRVLPLAMSALAAGLVALAVTGAHDPREAAPPLQVIVTPTDAKIALIAVDGLSEQLFASRPNLATMLPKRWSVAPLGGSTAERWATVGSGIRPEMHGVHAIEGFRIRGSANVLQAVSGVDVVLRAAARAGIVTRQPMPPSVRRRDFVWEIAGARGVAAVDVNWWTAGVNHGSSRSIAQAGLFSAAEGDPIRLDALATSRLMTEVRHDRPRLAVVYLPGLDIILNRSSADRSLQFAATTRALDGLESLVKELAAAGYAPLLVGMPGESQQGSAVVATLLPIAPPHSLYDVAPTLCNLFGFPASREMPGITLASPGADRIDSYGARRRDSASAGVTQEYYDSLKALGYIR
jgi:hypothetical protein